MIAAYKKGWELKLSCEVSSLSSHSPFIEILRYCYQHAVQPSEQQQAPSMTWGTEQLHIKTLQRWGSDGKMLTCHSAWGGLSDSEWWRKGNLCFLFCYLNLFLFLHSISASGDHTDLSLYYEDISSGSHNSIIKFLDEGWILKGWYDLRLGSW